MNFLKRGLLSTWSKKGRTILICAVFSAILIFVLAGLTIQSAAEKATTNAENSVGATATLSANREAMFGRATDSTADSTTEDAEATRPDPGSFQSTPVNVSDAEAIAALDNVASYSFETSSTAIAGDDIEPITSSDSEEETTESTTEAEADANGMTPPDGMGGGGGEVQIQMMNNGDFQISGVSSTEMVTSFSSGTAKIIDGEGITEEDAGTNNAVIETTLAEANDLAVGDTFTVQNSDEDESYEVTIKGIYETSESATGMAARISFMNPVNTIYSYYTFANTLNGDDGAATIDSAVYNLAEPSEMDTFVEEAEAIIDTDTYSITTNDQAYQQMLEPLNNVSSFAKNIVILVAVAGIIILTLIVMLMIRERRYEIGVLLSMGESRIKVIMQFFSEMFVAMVVALVIASFSGSIVGNVVGNQLLAQQNESQATAQADAGDAQENGGPGGGMQGGFGGRMQQGMNSISSAMTGSEEITELDITVEPTEIAMLAGFGLLISLLSILLSSIGILRLNPKKILIT